MPEIEKKKGGFRTEICENANAASHSFLLNFEIAESLKS